jgi:hypothetical protein
MRGAYVRLTLIPIGANRRGGVQCAAKSRIQMMCAFAAIIEKLVEGRERGSSRLILWNTEKWWFWKSCQQSSFSIARPSPEAKVISHILQGYRPAACAEGCHSKIALLLNLTPWESDDVISCSHPSSRPEADKYDLTSTILQPRLERLKLASFISLPLCIPTVVIVSSLQDGVELSRKRVQQSIYEVRSPSNV